MDFHEVTIAIWKRCETCKGTHLVMIGDSHKACPSCLGKGRKQRELTLDEFVELLTSTTSFGKLVKP